MKAARMSQGVGLLSLPDELLAKVAVGTFCYIDAKPYNDWVSAAMACKRLRDLQLSSHIYVKEYTSEASHRPTHVQPWHSVSARATSEVELP